MWVGLGATYLLQIPQERDWPGEPFLLFLLVVIGTTLCFGTRLGLISAAMSAFLSLYFFEPVGSPTLRYASDLNKIGLYAIIAFGCVGLFAHFTDTPTEESNTDNNKSMPLREFMHRIANNFVAIATFFKTKLVFGDVIEQVRMTRWPHTPAAAGTAVSNILGEVNGLWRDVIQIIPAAVYMTDAEGHITFYNEAAAALWGCRPDLGDSKFCGSWKLYWPDGTPLPHDECPLAMALLQKRPIRGMEAVAERPDGTRIPFVPYPTPLLDATGRLTGAVNMLVDISERMRAEQDKQRLAAIVDSCEDAIIGKDLSGIIGSWNAGAERLFGYAKEDVIGKSITLVIPPHLRDEEASILGRLARGERIEHFETTRMRKDGTLVSVSLSISPVRNGRSGVVGVSTIARDISERKRAEQALVERNIVLALAGRAAHVGSFAYDIETEIMEISDDYAVIHGFPEGTAKLARSECLATVHPEDVQQVELARTGAFRERRSEYGAEYRIIRPDGEVRWVEIRCFISYDGNEHPQRVIGVSIDATDRKQAELRLAERNTQIELASKTARVGSFALDLPTGLINLSPGCATILGLPDRTVAISRENARKLVHPEDLAQLDTARDQAFFRKQREFVAQFRIIRADDGEVSWIEARSLIFYDQGGQPLRYIAVIIDTTERKLAEQALAERNAQLGLAGRAALVGNYAYNTDTERIKISPGYAAIYGYPEGTAEISRSAWLDSVHPDDVERSNVLRGQAFRERRPEFNVDFRIVRSAGEVRWIEARSFISYYADGSPQRVIGVNIDVTERRRTEQVLTDRNRQLELAAKHALVGRFATEIDVARGDLKSQRAQVSPGFAAIYGLPEETTEISVGDWRSLVHSDDLPQYLEHRQKVFAERRGEHHAEFRIVRPCGTIRWIEARSFIEYDQAGHATRLVGVNIDITERKRAEEARKILNAELDHRVKNALATVAAVISHTREGNRSVAGFAAALEGRIRSMAATHQLLSSRHWQELSLMELIRRELEPYAASKNTEISGPTVLLKPEAGQALAMVFHELTTNAAKYGSLSTNKGRVLIWWDRRLNGRRLSNLVLEWREIGGPRINAPGKSSYGTSTIHDLIPYEFGGTVDLVFAPEGVRCRLELPPDWLINMGEPIEAVTDTAR
jgi:PAS domain S-box-containing protein